MQTPTPILNAKVGKHYARLMHLSLICLSPLIFVRKMKLKVISTSGSMCRHLRFYHYVSFSTIFIMIPILPPCEFVKHIYYVIYIVYFRIVDSLFPLTAYFHSSKNVRKMVDRTYYTDGAELTCQEKNHLIAFINDLQNYNTYYQTPTHYGQYVPLVHVLNYGNIHGDGMVRFFTITTSVHLLHTFF